MINKVKSPSVICGSEWKKVMKDKEDAKRKRIEEVKLRKKIKTKIKEE